MILPENFHFTASNLQDYLACERRFELKAIQQLLWPALPSQPVQEQEAHMRNGALFHQYIQQYFLGVPTELITNLINEPNLMQWWLNFLAAFPETEKASFVGFEYTLAGFIGSFPVLAKLDAIRLEDDQCLIYDWKTGFYQPKAQSLEKKIQTRLYMFMLAANGASIHQNKPMQPDEISMTYWYPEFPSQEIRLSYSQAQHLENEQILTTLMQEIVDKEPGKFALTQDAKTCQFCIYRSLCGRGTSAGEFSRQKDVEDDLDSREIFLQDLDWDQVQEIAF
jgi:hypothetical protein